MVTVAGSRVRGVGCCEMLDRIEWECRTTVTRGTVAGGARAWARWASTLVAAVGLVAGCSTASAPNPAPNVLGDDSITIASFDFPESELLAELYGKAIERAGIDVERATRIGARELVQPALIAGLVEFVPEYAGSAVEFLSLGESQPSPDIASTHEELTGLIADHEVVALAPAPAQDVNTIVVTPDTAERYGLQTVSDLGRVASELTFGGPPECPSRPFCLMGLSQRYGLTFERFVPLDTGGALTRQALDRGDVDVALFFSTDPIIQIDGLVELTDDLALQPAENVIPLVRAEILERWGSTLVDRVNQVSERLTTTELRQLNAEVAVALDVGRVADRWLDEAGIR
jgi:osmoprotectant transport system substrate-binding protein